MEKKVAVEICNLSKSFGKKKILNDLNLEVQEGEFLAILGPSGKGKSVLVKNLIGFYDPTAGEISYGFPRDKIGFSMQNNSFYDSLNVKQNWKYFGKMMGIDKVVLNERIDELLRILNLEDYKRVLVRKLSGGTQKRVDLGCCLLNNPDVIILDEPFAGLDQKLVESLSNYFVSLNRAGKTLIITSHQLKIISRICSRVVALKEEGFVDVPRDKLWEFYDDLG